MSKVKQIRSLVQKSLWIFVPGFKGVTIVFTLGCFNFDYCRRSYFASSASNLAKAVSITSFNAEAEASIFLVQHLLMEFQ